MLPLPHEVLELNPSKTYSTPSTTQTRCLGCRQEDQGFKIRLHREFKASLGNIRPCLQKGTGCISKDLEFLPVQCCGEACPESKVAGAVLTCMLCFFLCRGPPCSSWHTDWWPC